MSYTSFSGDLVLRALSQEEVSLELSDLIGCSIDDGVSEDAWIIETLPDESGTLTISNGKRTRAYPVQSLTNGNLEIPQERQELIEMLEGFRESSRPKTTRPDKKKSTHFPIRDNKSLIADFVLKRNIKSLFHFTRLENIKSILENGLVPRQVVSRSWWKFSGSILRAGDCWPYHAARSSITGSIG